MAKYSKAAAKSVKGAMRKMKQGKLTSGTSGKKVTSKKQAIAIGLSEAREKGAKVPAKKAAPGKKKTAPRKNAPAAKKSATPKTAVKKYQKAPVKKAAAKKSAAVKSPAKKKKTAASKAPGKKISVQAKANKPAAEAADTASSAEKAGEKVAAEPITNNDINNEVTPEAENAIFTSSKPEQQWIPEGVNATPQDPFHGNTNPSKAKTTLKPSGKKPLWDNRK